jgi:hypothetical protein
MTAMTTSVGNEIAAAKVAATGNETSMNLGSVGAVTGMKESVRA